MILFNEKVSCLKEELTALLSEHYEELTLHKSVVKLDVDWGKYEKLESLGVLKVITARLENELVGYAVFFVQPHIHYKNLLVASNDVLFLKKELRSTSRIGLQLIRESESFLEKLGVKKITWRVKKSNDWSALLLRRGCLEEDLVLSKILGDSHGI